MKKTITIALTSGERRAIEAMALRSEISVQDWARSALMYAAAVDAAHWAEMAEREGIKREIAADRMQFARLSSFLRQMPDGCFNVLVDHMVSEREKGRREGSESAKRLSAVRRGRRT